MAAKERNPGILTDGNLTASSLVVDVGAFDGSWALDILDRYQCRVESFELSPVFIPLLDERALSDPGWTVHPVGLGGAEAKVRVSRDFAGSSVFDNPHRDLTEYDVGTIRDIAAVWTERGWDNVDFMKINIEGGEFELLDRMVETGLAPHVDTYLIQFHEWFPRSHSRRRQIRHALARTHSCVWDYPFAWERWDRR